MNRWDLTQIDVVGVFVAGQQPSIFGQLPDAGGAVVFVGDIAAGGGQGRGQPSGAAGDAGFVVRAGRDIVVQRGGTPAIVAAASTCEGIFPHRTGAVRPIRRRSGGFVGGAGAGRRQVLDGG